MDSVGGGGVVGGGSGGGLGSTRSVRFPLWYAEPWKEDSSLVASMREADENERDEGMHGR
jgi:hypothetical protein